MIIQVSPLNEFTLVKYGEHILNQGRYLIYLSAQIYQK
jgi:hypothetical protein